MTKINNSVMNQSILVNSSSRTLIAPINLNFYSGKNVIVTGHTGFKGSWLTAWLKLLGANVTGISLDPPTIPSHFETALIRDGILDLRVDIRDANVISEFITSVKPDFIFHLAAQSLVHKAFNEPIETWQTNVMGTVNILNALRELKNPCVATLITSDKCYQNLEWVWGYRESDRLGGNDPYSSSKASAELAIHSYVNSYFSKEKSKVRIVSARAGNVIGGGDWAADRLIPDCIKSWSKNETAILRNPHSTRPWQHVLEPIGGYLQLALKVSEDSRLHGESFNFGPDPANEYSVQELVSEFSRHWDKVKWEQSSSVDSQIKESRLLKLNCDKAAQLIDWRAKLDFAQTVKLTAEWYKQFFENSTSINETTKLQITNYADLLQRQRLM
jgi:CDP-glucose 4,6-dehydratase